jgi:hypothetical protein
MADLLSGAKERPVKELLPKEESGLEADEKTFETAPESKDVFLEEAVEVAPTSRVIGEKSIPVAPPPPAAPKDEITLEVEKILEEGLGSMYATLPESARPKFKQKGELAATEISNMVRNLKLKVKRVLELIRDWLLTIPGLNRFFLEQEAKIKVDRIKELVEAKKEERLKLP